MGVQGMHGAIRMKYQTMFKDSEPIHGGWFSGEIVEAVNIKEARKKCGELYSYDKEFDPQWLNVKRVKK